MTSMCLFCPFKPLSFLQRKVGDELLELPGKQQLRSVTLPQQTEEDESVDCVVGSCYPLAVVCSVFYASLRLHCMCVSTEELARGERDQCIFLQKGRRHDKMTHWVQLPPSLMT